MRHQPRFEENPNPHAKIAFVVWTPFHYWVYKNIARHLPEAEFVVCDTWYATRFERGDEHIQKTIEFLKTKVAKWRVMTELVDSKVIEKFFEQYDVIVSVLLWAPLESLSPDNDWFSKKKSVLVSYGVGKDLNTFAPWVAQFDLSLAEGPRTHHYHKLLTESHTVGSPKHDDWFSRTINEEKIKQIKIRLDPKKKTILYLPTHSGLSSLHDFGDSVRELTDHYNLLVKLHYHNPLTEKHIVERLQCDPRVFLFDEQDDILPLLSLADIVMSDSSSAAFEAILVDKPLVVLDSTKDKERFEKHTRGEEFNDYWYSGGLTYRGSIEEVIKMPGHEVGVVIREKIGLLRGIEKALRESHLFTDNRKRLKEELFSKNDGRCGKRAAKVIRELLDREKPEPPLLGMAARAYFQNLVRNYKFQVEKNSNLIRQLTEEKDAYVRTAVLYTQIKNGGSFLKKIRLIAKHFF